ncbi:MAG: 1,4-alpha-glucan branching protein GlgB [Burkholderiales bacterium]|nr:1,4-alpha-glucan branching protein GlgB [Burkholderiales bacterium]
MNVDPILLLREGRLHDPHALLGRHASPDGVVVRHLDPHAKSVTLRTATGAGVALKPMADGLFEWRGSTLPPQPLVFDVDRGDPAGPVRVTSPWSFPPSIPDADLYLFGEGRLLEAWRTFGAVVHRAEVDGVGVDGVRFACWAPNAERVSVVGDFDRWDGRAHPMTSRGASGVWELFVPGLDAGARYRFEIRHRDSGTVFTRGDPFGQAFELRPGTAAVVAPADTFAWTDAPWLARRAATDWLRAPMNVYEVHAGSWKRHPDGRFWNWRELADDLVPYAASMGFTHIELLPVTEHPLDESWGYQTTGYFAPTARHGSPDDLRHFVDRCHAAGLGVILDWVPGHFPTDAGALARFDGTALFEHEDPRLGMHQDWGTHIFNYGRSEVRGFLLASAMYWLKAFHFDGLRVDAVASMLYLDYSRKAGEWLPNVHGGRENLEAIAFLRELNVVVHRECPGALTLAEESTAWPMVSRPAYLGGLGFSMKWNMGWMNDTLFYLQRDPVHRRWHHDKLTFGQMYAYSENFMLPLSHDEVVHGKRSLIDKMPGDAWQRFANLRLLLALQACTPGRKLLFMGGEFAQGREWRVGGELDWALLSVDWHQGVQTCVRDLNHLVRDHPALHTLDFEPGGFAWIDCRDAEHSVLGFRRIAADGRELVAVFNFTPVVRHRWRVGVPHAGRWRERFNSDSRFYGGSDVGNWPGPDSRPGPWMDQPHSIEITLPPLAAVVFECAG